MICSNTSLIWSHWASTRKYVASVRTDTKILQCHWLSIEWRGRYDFWSNRISNKWCILQWFSRGSRRRGRRWWLGRGRRRTHPACTCPAPTTRKEGSRSICLAEFDAYPQQTPKPFNTGPISGLDSNAVVTIRQCGSTSSVVTKPHSSITTETSLTG